MIENTGEIKNSALQLAADAWQLSLELSPAILIDDRCKQF